MNILSEILDEIQVLQTVRNMDFVSDIYLFGYSQGGVVASMVAGYFCDIIKALILIVPAAVLRANCEAGDMLGQPYDPKKPPKNIIVNIFGEFTFGEGYLRTGRHLPIYEVAADYEGPVCMVRGNDDIIVPLEYCEKYAQIYKNCEFHKLDGCDHMTICPDQRMHDIILDFLAKNR